MKFGHISLYFGAVILSAAGAAACDTTANTNTNVNTNDNAVLTNTTATPTPRTADGNISREEYDRDREAYERDKGDSTIGQGINDSWLWFKTKTALAAAEDLRDSTINVDVVNDVITLRGSVATAAQRAQAERVAEGIAGQKDVRNEIVVRPDDSMTNQMVNGNTSNSNSR
jgi:hypothetical protein